MKPELEALLKLLDAFVQGDPKDPTAKERFESALQEYSLTSGVPAEKLTDMVRKKYWSWLKANARHTSIPPKA